MSVKIDVTFSDEGFEDFLDLLYWITTSPLRAEYVELAEVFLNHLEGDEED